MLFAQGVHKGLQLFLFLALCLTFPQIKQRHLLPEYDSFPVYVDSPLANEATAIFLQCDPVCLDGKTREIMAGGQNPIWFDGLNTTVTTDESKSLNADTAPKVIISSGGMCEGGRIRHHLKHHLWNKNDTILFAGYQANGTLGRQIFDGAKSVRIFSEQIDVNAEIVLLEGVSGHADREGLLEWLSHFENRPYMVFVNHGDDDSCSGFARTVADRFGMPAYAPFSGSEYDLIRKEWIRLADPVYKQTGSDASARSVRKKKDSAYSELREAVRALDDYTACLSGHSNHELKKLTEAIRSLISGLQD